MSTDLNQRDVSRNQSTLDICHNRTFIGNNSFESASFKNNTSGTLVLLPSSLVVRNGGTFESASMAFSATPLAAGETVIIAGLTFTSTGATTQAQLAAAFANLAVGATTGAGTGQGTYTGTLTGYSSGAVSGTAVVFTASTTGNKTNLAATGTGALPTATITAGTDGVVDGVIPATLSNVKDVIGIVALDESVSLASAASVAINYATEGKIDETKLSLPAFAALDNVVPGSVKTLRDILNSIGFALEASTDNTKYDN